MLKVRVEKRLGEFQIKATFNACQGFTALLGASGAGKSSVVNLIAGLLKPDKGLITANGKVLFDSDRKINLPPERRKVGYVFQDGRLFPHLNVKSNLLYGMQLVPPRHRRISFDGVVDLMGISHLLKRRSAKLSGGERQRVALARALLTNPRILLMDEPLASLDQARKNEVLPYLAELPQKLHIPIIYVSHSPEEVDFLADCIVDIYNGKIIAARPSSKAK
jgi:molybdate transport system ATP-binding protein